MTFWLKVVDRLFRSVPVSPVSPVSLVRNISDCFHSKTEFFRVEVPAGPEHRAGILVNLERTTHAHRHEMWVFGQIDNNLNVSVSMAQILHENNFFLLFRYSLGQIQVNFWMFSEQSLLGTDFSFLFACHSRCSFVPKFKTFERLSTYQVINFSLK